MKKKLMPKKIKPSPLSMGASPVINRNNATPGISGSVSFGRDQIKAIVPVLIAVFGGLFLLFNFTSLFGKR